MVQHDILGYMWTSVGSTVDCRIFIDRVALAKPGDNALGSVRPFECLSLCVHSHV